MPNSPVYDVKLGSIWLDNADIGGLCDKTCPRGQPDELIAQTCGEFGAWRTECGCPEMKWSVIIWNRTQAGEEMGGWNYYPLNHKEK